MVELAFVILTSGLLASIAIPNFIKFQARSKQSEAKANLKAIYTNRGELERALSCSQRIILIAPENV